MKLRYVFQSLIIILMLIHLCGCVAAYVGGVAADAISGTEKTKVDAAISPNVTPEQLGKIKRVVILLNDNATQEALGSGGLTDILSDNITMEMMKQGFECVETGQLKQVLEKQDIKIQGPIDLENAMKAGKELGVQAIITGNVKCSTSSKSSALLVSGKVTSAFLIQSATLKIIGVENGESMMVVSINYKNGQKADSAAKSMVKILKAKIDNPSEKKG